VDLVAAADDTRELRGAELVYSPVIPSYSRNEFAVRDVDG
jgi:hypothetical protein